MDEDLSEFSAAANYLLKHWPPVLKAWGFTKTAGKIHALLLAHPTALTSDEIMGTLDISRGGVSTQLGILHSSGLVERLKILGERHEKFTAIRNPDEVHVALQSHLEQNTVLPLLEMRATVSAISGKGDLHWFNTLYALGGLHASKHTSPQ